MNNNKPTLVILAAGMGSRYGGLKQLDTFSPQGDTILDFSLYDALRAGFKKIIFIIRKNIEKEFRAIFDKKLRGKAEVEYVFQEIENVPEKYQNPDRIKPWGTAHALLMAKDAISENFAVINADDFYGKEAFEIMAKTLMDTNKRSYKFYMVGYLLKNTVSDYGHVSRGECKVDEEGLLTSVIERTHIEKVDNGSLIRKDDDGNFIPIDKNSVVSMNFWGFTPRYFEFGTQLFTEFLEKNKHNLKAEFFIPIVVNQIVNSEKASVKVLKSDSKWFGVTYKEDKKLVENEIANLKAKNIYPVKLF
ncbi:MAG: nucleotide-diphospho-sugar transferase [Flavobacteriales bacterium]|nr:MAG: nucleotide-diphospho-sugar transferase [Flavobacteriales bacterium]